MKKVRSLLWRTGVYGKLRMYPVRARGRRFDSRHGVRTADLLALGELGVEGGSAADGNDYEAVDPKLFRRILRTLDIRHEEFVFVDFGSGMGRALLLASELPFRKVVGVEFSPRLHRIAEENIRRYGANPARRCADVESVCADAADYPAPALPTVFFFYNPFREGVLTRVLANIRASLRERPRDAWVIYVNPKLDHLFGGDGELKRVASGKGNAISYTVYRSAAGAGRAS